MYDVIVLSGTVLPALGPFNCIYPVRGKPYNAFPEPWKKARSFLEYIKAFFAFGKVFKLNFASQVYKSSRMARFIDERCKVEFEH